LKNNIPGRIYLLLYSLISFYLLQPLVIGPLDFSLKRVAAQPPGVVFSLQVVARRAGGRL
jgi:hypothetical protein